jgi:hypothetical protein
VHIGVPGVHGLLPHPLDLGFPLPMSAELGCRREFGFCRSINSARACSAVAGEGSGIAKLMADGAGSNRL